MVSWLGFQGQGVALAGFVCEVKEQQGWGGVMAHDVLTEAEAHMQEEAAIGALVDVGREVEDFPEGGACRRHV